MRLKPACPTLAPNRHDTHYVVYRDSQGHLKLISWVGEAAGIAEDLNAPTGAPPAAQDASGDPSMWLAPNANWMHAFIATRTGRCTWSNGRWVAPRRTPTSPRLRTRLRP